VLVIALLFAWNVYAAIRNQRLHGPQGSPRPRSRNIATVAAQHPMPVIRHTFALYYRLRMLAGKTLVVPEWLGAHRFHLERVSRLRVELVPEALALSVEATDRLAPEIDRWWALDSGSPLAVILGDDVDRYVLVERAGREWYLMLPEAMYRQELARKPMR
jgi:hypothetical protein